MLGFLAFGSLHRRLELVERRFNRCQVFLPRPFCHLSGQLHWCFSIAPVHYRRFNRCMAFCCGVLSGELHRRFGCDCIGLIGVCLFFAAGSVRSVKPVKTFFTRRFNRCSYTVLVRALFPCAFFCTCSLLFLGLSCIGVAPK